jgi:BON domain
MLSSSKCVAIALALALGTCAGVRRADAQQLLTEVVPVAPDQAQRVTHSSVSLDKDSASSVGHHHYNSDAERAQDDLVITDADHGTVTLSGVVASTDDIKAATEDAAAVPGVVAVKNQLRPH